MVRKGSPMLETPPRAWGRQVHRRRAVPFGGNTPTGVGTTIQQAVKQARREKHPHGRGDDTRQVVERAMSEETPPRAWGRLVAAVRVRRQGGNTPTGVGTTMLF